MLFVYLIIFAIIAGCNPPDTTKVYNKLLPTDTIVDVLVDEYVVRYGKGEECRDYLSSVVYVGTGELIQELGKSIDCSRCAGSSIGTKAHPYVWVNEKLAPARQNLVKVHEFIHNLLYCMKVKDIDHGTIDTWCNIDGERSYGCFTPVKDDVDSLEYVISEIVYFWVENVETY